MKAINLLLLSLCWCMVAIAQNNSPDSNDIFFQHLQLNEITVTGLTGDAKPKELPTPVTLINAKTLRQTSATNLIDAVAHQPGVSQLTTGSGISKPIIRGLGFDRIVTVSDGVRQEGQQWGDEHGIEIDAAQVGSVEILKGPASLMYGSDAMAGVFIFHPTAITPEGEIRANVAGEYQSNNGLAGYSANIEGNQGGLVWNGRWSQRLAHAYRNSIDGYVPGSQFREQSAAGLLGLNRTWGHSHLRLAYYALQPGIVEGNRDSLTGRLLSESNDLSTYELVVPFQKVQHYKAVWDNKFYVSGDGQLKAVVAYQHNRRQEYEESSEECGLDFLLHTATYDFRYTHAFPSSWKLAAGLGGMYQQSLNQGDEYLIPAYTLFDLGLYSTVSRTLECLSVSGGLRFDSRRLHSEPLEEEGILRFSDFSRHFEGLTGSIGAVYAVSKGLDIKANMARGYRAPNISELASNGIHEGTLRYEIGNQQLKPEYSWQADLGLDFNGSLLSAQLSLFANRIENYVFASRVDVVRTDGYDTYRYQQGDARLLGFEASVDVHPIHSLHIANTFSFVDAQQLHQPESTKYLPQTPAPRWECELKYELTHDGRLFNNAFLSVSMDYYFRQDHYYRADNTETATPSYLLLNFSAGSDIVWHGRKVAECYLAVQNLADVAYQSHLSRLKYTEANPLTGHQGIYNMGRNIALKLIVPIQLKRRGDNL